MKQIILTLITVFSMFCLVACGGEQNNDTNAGSKNDEPVVTAEPTVEVTPAPAEATPEPTVEPTPEPTPDPYADLSGKEWVKTFKDVVYEPTVVVFNDETARKEIVEPNDLILVTDANDVLALLLPEGYAMTGKGDMVVKDWVSGEGYEIFYLDFEEMVKQKYWMPILTISYEGNKSSIEFEIQTRE